MDTYRLTTLSEDGPETFSVMLVDTKTEHPAFASLFLNRPDDQAGSVWVWDPAILRKLACDLIVMAEQVEAANAAKLVGRAA